jgi:predicted nuclease of predicted toxin-antitoxin system
MRILVDMNLSPRWIEFFAEAGFEAIHWTKVGPNDARDSDLLKWAAEHDHVVLTSDLDFGAILAVTREEKPSVIQLRSDVLAPERAGPMVLAVIRQTHEDLAEGALVSIDAARARLRLLPLRR